MDTVAVTHDFPLNIAEFSNGFIKNITQQYAVESKKISIIKGLKGLKVTINPSALEREDGSAVEGRINVSLIELTNSDDLFKSNVATMCNDRLLASGGSYFIGLENKGRQVRIKKGRTIQVDFPAITEDEMELFYGKRNDDGNMNWNRAGSNLVPVPEEPDLISINRDYEALPEPSRYITARLKLYRSLNEKVYYYNKRITVQELVDTLNRDYKKVFLETVITWPKELDTLPEDKWVDTAFLLRKYGPKQQYYVKTYKSLEDEKERMARLAAQRDSMRRNWKPQSLAGQIQKYYQPSAISALGWINCDRFYRYREMTDLELNIPITLNKSKIQFFLVFKSFNGLMNFNIDTIVDDRNVFRSLPVGERVSLIGFSKSNGRIYHCKEDFVIRKKQPVSLAFKNLPTEEMIKMFGKNVRI